MPSSAWNFAANVGIVIPAGIIVPFNDVASNIPAGWEHWTLGADRALKGAVSAGVTGGSSNVYRYTNTEGDHTGASYIGWGGSVNGSTVDKLGSSSGAHDHSLLVNYSPARRLQVMMKAVADSLKFPPKTGILSDATLPGLTDITPTGHILCGAAGTSSSNVAAESSVSSVSTAGAHTHLSGVANVTASGTAAATNYGQGNHTHSGTPSVTDNINRYYMGMWASAAEEISAIEGVYGLWESSSPPPGWAICDGTRGTPDLRDYFIGFDSGAVMGTKTGNGTITTSASLTTNGGHTHNGTSATRNSITTAYHSNSITHAHTVGPSAGAFEPLNRTVVFIKAIG